VKASQLRLCGLAKVNVPEVPVALSRIEVSETARDLGVVIGSQLTLLRRWPLCVAVATTSYGSYDHALVSK